MKPNWKEKYRTRWPKGFHRVNMVKEDLSSVGLKTKYYGFMADSTEYSSKHPSEPGIPDLQLILFPDVLIEVTGTTILKPTDPLYFRPDKFEWPTRHPEFDVWGAHVVTDLGLIRYLKMENASRFQIVGVEIEGDFERYRLVPTEFVSPRSFLVSYLSEKTEIQIQRRISNV